MFWSQLKLESHTAFYQDCTEGEQTTKSFLVISKHHVTLKEWHHSATTEGSILPQGLFLALVYVS